MKTSAFSPTLQQKIDRLKAKNQAITLGKVKFSSPFLLAPMSMISKAPFRRLMLDLGAGGCVSELISCHGINYKNKKTLDMLKIDPRESHCGIQLFGEDAEKMAEAALIAIDQERTPDFIDINMGCPVRKVVSKGGGSALLKETKTLGSYLSTIKKVLPNEIPLTIKIRTGWDEDSRNADEVIRIAHNEGVEFVAIHGRTRTQQYTGLSDWAYIETLCSHSPLPLIGNGDLNTALQVQSRLRETPCQALMLGRGPLRNPFLFLESNQDPNSADRMTFDGPDFYEVIRALKIYLEEHADLIGQKLEPRIFLVTLRKHIIWLAAGFKGAPAFRDLIFKSQNLNEILLLCRDFFSQFTSSTSIIDYEENFMTSGHG